MEQRFKSFVEDLKIVKKRWDFKLNGFKVEINDGIQHSLVDRTHLRTSLALNDIKSKIQNGIDYIGRKYDKKKITNKVMVSLIYKKSDFKVLVLVNPDEKYMRISTIMNVDMPTKGDIKWNLNEFQQHFWKLQIDGNECFCMDSDKEYGTLFLVEPSLNESDGTHEIFLQEDLEDFIID